MFGERTGDGAAALLALHGWRHSHTDLAKVTDGFDAIALDLPGFGSSPEPNALWGAFEYAKSIAGVLEEFSSPAVVFGHSFGGRIALYLATLRPDKVRALVLSGTPLIRRSSGSKAPLSFRVAKWANKVGILSDARMEAERNKRGSADYRRESGLMRDVFVKVVNESYEDQLRAIECPVEMVWGEHDTEAPLWQAQEALELLKNGKLTVVPGGTHWITTENPAPIREAIERVLS